MTENNHNNTITFLYDNFGINKIHEIKKEYVSECVEISKENKDIKKIIIYGSSVREDCTTESDIDICLVMENDYNRLSLHYTIVKIIKACDHNCDIVVYDKLTDKFKEVVKNTGVIVYEP